MKDIRDPGEIGEGASLAELAKLAKVRGRRPLLEKAFQRQVIDLARLNGFLCFHTFDSRRSEPGYPDLVLVKPGLERPIFIEIKTEDGRLTDAQARWGAVLESIPGADYRIWRPRDWDEIESTLTSGRGPHRVRSPVAELPPLIRPGSARRQQRGEE